jgi:hypothetical protein
MKGMTMGTVKALVLDLYTAIGDWQADVTADQFEKECDEWRALFDDAFPDEEPS